MIEWADYGMPAVLTKLPPSRSHRINPVDVLRRACGWWTVGAAVAAAAIFAIVALKITPPAFSVASSCVTILAVALAVRLIAWVAVAGASFGREERLLAFVMMMAVGFGWLGAREWIAERDFDYRAAQQKADLILVLRDLSSRIDAFAHTREREAPPRPRPATWQRDEDNVERFEEETADEYERRFGAKVRFAHDLVGIRGVRDRDFDTFYRHPANEFQIRVVAKRLNVLATTLGRRR
jgi:hypothetical protein